MPRHILLLLALLFVGLHASPAPAELNQRDNVAVCEAVLIALKASAFCSSFINLHDVTSTSTKSAPATIVTNTITVGCTTSIPSGISLTTDESISLTTSTITVFEDEPIVRFAVRALETMAATTAAETPAPGMIGNLFLRLFNRAPNTTGKTTTTTAKTTATATTTAAATSCQVAGLPVSLAPFACSVISSACSAYVHPKTSTITTAITPTSTSVKSVNGVCLTVTGPASISTIVETSTMTIVTTFLTASLG